MGSPLMSLHGRDASALKLLALRLQHRESRRRGPGIGTVEVAVAIPQARFWPRGEADEAASRGGWNRGSGAEKLGGLRFDFGGILGQSS